MREKQVCLTTDHKILRIMNGYHSHILGSWCICRYNWNVCIMIRVFEGLVKHNSLTLSY